jgi:tetratricopeptide (TPR) repeat protein
VQKDNPQFQALELALWATVDAPSFAYDRSLRSDPAAFTAGMDRAWTDKRWTDFTLMAEAQARAGPLSPKAAIKLAFVLMHTGRHEHAARLLQQHRAALEDRAFYWRDLARAFAGCGRLAEASEAVRLCLDLDPDETSALELKVQLDEAVALEARGAQRNWSEAHRLIEMLHGFRALRPAAAVARGFLGRASPPRKPWRLREQLQAALVAFHSLEPQEALPALWDLQRLFGKGPERRFLDAVAALLLGEGDDAAAVEAEQACLEARTLRLCAAVALQAAGRLELAAGRLGRLADEHQRDWEVRLALAWTVGRIVLERTPLAWRSEGPRKVFDLLMFNNETEVLRAKLSEESPWVDRFVIVEARQTFTGAPKPLHFERAKSEFAAFADKITHVVVDAFPAWATTPWARDFYQRDMALSGASGQMAVDDLVMVTDADEIVDRGALDRFNGEFAAMRMDSFRFFLNCRSTQGTQRTGVLMRAGQLQRFGSSFARFVLRNSRFVQDLDDCGWHFSSMGDAAGIALKMQSYAHQEHAQLDEHHFAAALETIRSGVMGRAWERVELDQLPAYVRSNQSRLASLMIPADGGA